jgi:phosphonate transport system substrate-binding protein
MRTLANCLAFLLGVASLGGAQAWAAEPAAQPIRFAALPMVDERSLRGQFLPMLDHLARRTGLEFQWTYFPKYDDLLRALREDQLDLAYLGPLPYVKLTERDRRFESLARFLEQDGSQGYDCALVAFPPDGLTNARQIAGKRIGLTQPESTCGHFAVSVMLDRAGRRLEGDGNQHEYAGGHDKAILGVLHGRYDVAGVKLAIVRRYASLGIRAIDRVGPYPGFALVANARTLSPGRRGAIRDALLAASPEERGGWGEPLRHGAIAARDEDYARLRADLRRLEGGSKGKRR